MIEPQVDEWLKMWHTRSSSERHGGGYPGTAAGCSLYRPSRQYDDENGALDAATDIAIADAVGEVISTMTVLHQAALSMEARNLCSVRVWRSARVPSQDAAAVIKLAKVELWDGMERRGLADSTESRYYADQAG
jgi:hypothetical protein